jgi:hypothetical protein
MRLDAAAEEVEWAGGRGVTRVSYLGYVYGRLLGVAQLAVGCLLCLRPEQVAASAAGPRGRPVSGRLVRVLGLRSLVQGAVITASPSAAALAGGAIVDATHAATMTPFIALCARYRRAAAVSATVAGVAAAVGALAAARTPPARAHPIATPDRSD